MTIPDGILGLHHVTALASDPRANLAFYRDRLGLRLVKRTVNFDDPGTYHLYYGDELGRPGTIVTFFPWPGARRGQPGAGQAVRILFAVPEGAVGAWRERLRDADLDGPREVDGAPVLLVKDPDGLEVGLIEVAASDSKPFWEGGGVPGGMAIRGVVGVRLLVEDGEQTARLLTERFGLADLDGASRRFGRSEPGGEWLELQVDPRAERGRVAAGSIHHVAFRVADDAHQEKVRGGLLSDGLHVTPQLDRNYFRSVYFREPGGVLFELATDPPGFTVDEPAATLGSDLKLPDWLEPVRERIEASLPLLEPMGAAAAGGSHG
ncbi:MAG TPA: ring-cleaving dioxygenase [Thermoanaerobaculia bacterium]|nr:ring-cleaving dioxygenase [Thermoanaerobaculia bacterium]